MGAEQSVPSAADPDATASRSSADPEDDEGAHENEVAQRGARSRQTSSGGASLSAVSRSLPSLASFFGYHILKVQDGSPADDAGLQPYFDYIVTANQTRLDEENSKLMDIIASNIDRKVHMDIYSAKTMTMRRVSLIPSRQWGGGGVLGCSVRFCDFEHADEMIFHVLEIHADSPAATAGLKSGTDYIIGSSARPLSSEDDFALLMASHDQKPLQLFVYNADDDQVRIVDITPNSEWGGAGSLGCAIGHGLIHRIPQPAP